jgi:hypothetical protein
MAAWQCQDGWVVATGVKRIVAVPNFRLTPWMQTGRLQ